MSKLLDRLERLSEGRAQPLGFEAAVSRAKAVPMLVIAGMFARDNDLASAATKEGADALLFTIESLDTDEQALAQSGEAAGDIPWGVFLPAITGDDVRQLLKMGCDFVVFTPEKARASVLAEDNIGKVLQIDPSLDEHLMRIVGRLSINAVLFSQGTNEEYPLTVHQLMICENLIGGTSKHLLATMPPQMPVADLETLWNLGARGVLIDITSDNVAERIPQIKEAIQKLPTTRKKTDRKFGALLPRNDPLSAIAEPDDDDYDDDDDDI